MDTTQSNVEDAGIETESNLVSSFAGTLADADADEKCSQSDVRTLNDAKRHDAVANVKL